MSETLSTKEKILATSLDLFAEKGFEGASVDMIAAAIGIKGPSLYKHFKGKAEILDALITKVSGYYTTKFEDSGHLAHHDHRTDDLPRSIEELIHSTFARINFTMHDETVQKMRRFLTIEQFRNSRIAELANFHSYEGLLQRFSKLFTALMKTGLLVEGDANIMALEFIAPVSLMIQSYDRDPSKEKEIVKKIKAHLKHFGDTYGKQ